MRIIVDGGSASGVGAKDVILAIIATIGAGGGDRTRHRVRGLDDPRHVDGRAHDRLQHVHRSRRARRHGRARRDDVRVSGRPALRAQGRAVASAARGLADPAERRRRALRSRSARSMRADIAPTVTWGTSPQDALPITARVPDPAAVARPRPPRRAWTRALAYMGLRPGTPLDGRAGQPRVHRLVHQQPARRPAGRGARREGPASRGAGVGGAGLGADQARGRGRRARPRSSADAGFEWREAGCSMCVGHERRHGRRAASASRPRRTATSRGARARARART